MSNIKAQVKEEVKNLIIENNGELLNKHILEIYRKYKPIVGMEIVTITQNVCNYFRFSPFMEEFRKEYNFH